MAEALLITRDDLVRFTALNGNIDTDTFIQWIKVAQDIHIQQYTGTDLLNKIKADIVAGTLANPYLDLVETYLKPMLIHWAMVEYLPFMAYTMANKGIFKHSSENASPVDKNEVDFLIEKQRYLAQNYTERFVQFMIFSGNTFPEYYTNTNSDIYPNTDSNYTGWVI
jgi:hypothetical protein